MIKKFKYWILTAIVGITGTTGALFGGEIICAVDKPYNELSLKTDVERAQIKAQYVARCFPIGTYTDEEFGVTIEVKSAEFLQKETVTGTKNAVSILARAWKNGKQASFGKNGEVEWERFNLYDPPILLRTATGPIERRWTHEDGHVSVSYRTENPEAAVKKLLAHAVRSVAQYDKTMIAGKEGNTTSVLRPVGGPGIPSDCRVQRQAVDETLVEIRAGAGNNTPGAGETNGGFAVPRLSGSATSNKFDVANRGLFSLDSSVVGTDEISSSSFSIDGTGRVSNLGVTTVELTVGSTTPGSMGECGIEFYNIANYGNDSLADGIGTDVFATTGSIQNVYQLYATSGLSAINKTGYTILSLRLGWDVQNSFDCTWQSSVDTEVAINFADEIGTDEDPVLVIEHAVAAVAAPEEDEQSIIISKN